MRMRIEYVMPGRSGHYVFARALEPSDFTLSATAKLGGIRIKQFVSQPREKKPDGTPDFSVFAFEPLDSSEKSKWIVGTEVILEE